MEITFWADQSQPLRPASRRRVVRIFGGRMSGYGGGVIGDKCVISVWRSLSLKELVSDLRLSFRGWRSFILRDDNFVPNHLLLTTSTMLSGHPRTELAFLITLFSFYPSADDMLYPQQIFLSLMWRQFHTTNSLSPRHWRLPNKDLQLWLPAWEGTLKKLKSGE